MSWRLNLTATQRLLGTTLHDIFVQTSDSLSAIHVTLKTTKRFHIRMYFPKNKANKLGLTLQCFHRLPTCHSSLYFSNRAATNHSAVRLQRSSFLHLQLPRMVFANAQHCELYLQVVALASLVQLLVLFELARSVYG